MIESWHKQLDSKKIVGAVLMDLSKAFDCVNHDLLVAKLDAYGFSKDALSLIYSYLRDRSQRVEVDGVFSSWKNIDIGVPQGSILGPLLFNIYINDLFFSIENYNVSLCNYADDNTLFSSDSDLTILLARLEKEMNSICLWFFNNGLQLNADKCQLLILGKPKQDDIFLYVNGEKIVSSDSVDLLGVTIDCDLSYTKHGDRVCKKIAAKLKALQRIAPYMPETKRKLLADSFVASEANYCPLIWNFSSRAIINNLERLNMKSSKLTSSLQVQSVHRRHYEVLLREVYKTKFGLNPDYLKDNFKFKSFSCYGLRNTDSLIRNRMRTSKHGLNTVTHIATLLWESLPHHIRNLENFDTFKAQLKSLDTLHCRCHLCTPFIKNLGFI